MGHARTVTLLSLIVSATSPWRLAAQCPDGSAPPCGRAAAHPPALNSVAVLFFEAHDTADEYLADGLTEDLTSLLGSVASVQVKASGVVRRAQRIASGNMQTLAHTLAVHYLMDGSLRRIGARVRVSAQLLNGATAVAVWGDVFDRTPDELLTLPSLIAREVATRVGGPAPALTTASFGTLRTRSPASYDHYLRGNFLLALRSTEGTARALAEYQEAERLDSAFAAAIGRAAYTYAIARVHHYQLPDTPTDSLVVRGLRVANRALRRDSGSSDAWMARGYLLAYAHPQTMDDAVTALERAIALDPKNAEAHHQYATILDWLARYDDADREERLALSLDPGRAITYADLSGSTHFRDTALALTLSDSAVALDAASAHVRAWRVLARLVAGDARGALDDADLANRLQPGDLMAESVLALALAHAGDSTRARAVIAHWSGGTDFWLVMAALVAVGDTAGALDRVEHARPDPELWAMLLRPEFDGLHGSQRYQRLLAMLRPVGAAGP